MEINERIKQLRKNLKLSQTAFGEKIGVSRDVINNIDRMLVEAKPLMIKHICEVFAVNREWLEHGTGEMFDESSPSIVDMLVEKYDLSDTARKILDVYITLDTDDKDAIDRFVQKVAETMEAKPDSPAVSAVMQQYSNEAMVARGASEPLKPFTPEQDAQMLSETDPDDL
jgi:transcriptional regulator with XRE-family HTH domain